MDNNRKLEFDEEAAQAAGMAEFKRCTAIFSGNPDWIAMFRAGARWQFEKCAQLLAEKDARIAELEPDKRDEIIKRLKNGLVMIRKDSSLWKAKAGGADKYQGMPPFCRLIDATLSDVKYLEQSND